MPREHRAFFAPGVAYRAPAFVATSSSEAVARLSFLASPPFPPPSAEQRPPFQEHTLWKFHFDCELPESVRCRHVNFIPSDLSMVGGEDEYLFVPYSCFTVCQVRWQEGATSADHPHVIEVQVAPDNKRMPEDLLVAPWY